MRNRDLFVFCTVLLLCWKATDAKAVQIFPTSDDVEVLHSIESVEGLKSAEKGDVASVEVAPPTTTEQNALPSLLKECEKRIEDLKTSYIELKRRKDGLDKAMVYSEAFKEMILGMMGSGNKGFDDSDFKDVLTPLLRESKKRVEDLKKSYIELKRAEENLNKAMTYLEASKEMILEMMGRFTKAIQQDNQQKKMGVSQRTRLIHFKEQQHKI